jgi:hypothetical protein
VSLSTKVLSGIAIGLSSVFVVLFSWLIYYWRRDLPYQRVEQARAGGRDICDCTDSGVIMLLTKREPVFDTYVCPQCKQFILKESIGGVSKNPPT